MAAFPERKWLFGAEGLQRADRGTLVATSGQVDPTGQLEPREFVFGAKGYQRGLPQAPATHLDKRQGQMYALQSMDLSPFRSCLRRVLSHTP